MNFLITARAALALTYRGKPVTISSEIGGIFGDVVAEAPSKDEAIEYAMLVMRQKCPHVAGWDNHEVKLKEIE